MQKTVETSTKALQQAEFIGTVKRIAKLVNPHRVEFTVDIKQTVINGELFTIGNRVTFEVNNMLVPSSRILNTLANLALGDETTIKVEKREGRWHIVDLANRADRGRPFEDYLKDLEEEQRARKH